MSKDEIKEANRRIRIVLRKHGFTDISVGENPEVWMGEIEGETVFAEVGKGKASVFREYLAQWGEHIKFFEDLAGAEI